MNEPCPHCGCRDGWLHVVLAAHLSEGKVGEDWFIDPQLTMRFEAEDVSWIVLHEGPSAYCRTRDCVYVCPDCQETVS